MSNFHRYAGCSTSALTMALAVFASNPAAAQSAPEIGQTAETTAEPAEATGDVLVTGSRISRRDLVSNSPIVTLAEDAFNQTSAVTLEDTLNRLPQFAPATGATSNDGLAGGITTLALRSLNSNRTLVLLDGKRLPASTATGAVDINNVPTPLIDSVEIITGGASAAYGSDAIAGVVNFKLNHRFSGLKLDAQAGITERGDGGTQRASLTGGFNFGGDRGNFVASVNYEHRDSVLNRDRAFSTIVRPSSLLPFGAFVPSATNLPNQTATNAVFARYGVAAGAVNRGATLAFNNDGSLFVPTGGINYRSEAFGIINVGGNIFYNSTGVANLTIPFERYGAYARGEYEVVDDISVYAEGGYQHFTSGALFAPAFATVTVPSTNPFIPADLRTILQSRTNPTAAFSLNRRYGDVGQRQAITKFDNYRVVAGVTGALRGIDGSFDIYYSRGQTKQTQLDRNGFSLSALSALLNAADGGASLCAGGFNPFGAQANVACGAYIRRNTSRDTTAVLDVIEATVQGRAFKLPAGDLRFAVGADYRRDSFSFEPDAALRTGDVASFLNGVIPPVNGAVSVKEVYGELLIPLIHDTPLIQDLNLNLSYRYSDYNTSGGISTYRAQGDWKIVDGLRIRGGYSRAVRAPNIGELFSPLSPSSPVIGAPGAVGQGDPCDIRSAYRTGASAAQVRTLCIAQGIPQSIIDTYTFTNTQIVEGGTTGGNANLRPEVADTYTVGGVLTPGFKSPLLSKLSLTVDYYKISLGGAIGTLAGAQVLQKCFNLDGSNPSFSNANEYCRFFGRSGDTGQVNRISLSTLNLGSYETTGIDFALDWQVGLDTIGLANAGKLRLNTAVTYIDTFKIANFPGAPAVDQVGSIGSTASYPRWKAVANLVYSNDILDVGVQYRYIDKMIDASAVGVPTSTAIGVPSFSYVDASIGLAAADNFKFRVGVNNLLNKAPPVYTSFSQSNTNPGVYDVLGRSFFFGIQAKY